MARPAFLFTFLLLAGSALTAAEPASFERAGRSLSQGRFKDAARELRQVAWDALPSLRTPTGSETKILRQAVESARTFLKKGEQPVEDRKAARQVLCLSRAYLPEELDGMAEALRVGGGVQRPELIGKSFQRYSAVARKAQVQGVVIVESVIDKEGCVRNSRVLKGLPLGLNTAALNAVRSWVFEPARFKERPVAAYYVVTVNFVLKADSEPWDR